MSSDTKPPQASSARAAGNAPGRAASPAAAGQPGDPRRERLAQALRDNLKKRKAQQRRRAGRQQGPGEGDDGPAGGG
ncbi:MAG: hypothetical protein ACFCUW_17015 [Kiloniellaceae bacterium]